MRSLMIPAYVLLGVLVCMAIILTAVFLFSKNKTKGNAFWEWAAVCDAPQCAAVAKEIFDKRGGIGDAAVAVLLCMGVTAPHLTGLGANASIVPGAVAGYKALHSKIGRLPWKDLFLPAIRLAKDGFEIGPHLAEAIASNQQLLSQSPLLKERFTISATGSILRKGDKLV
ncbi:glutathione hydrolase 1 proenzyme-like [Haemaphysalis longicornis]